MRNIFIGCPVKISHVGRPPTGSWVGYVRRINWKTRIAEVGPETCIGSHLRPYEIDRLVHSEFSKVMHPKLPDEIERLRRDPRNETLD